MLEIGVWTIVFLLVLVLRNLHYIGQIMASTRRAQFEMDKVYLAHAHLHREYMNVNVAMNRERGK